MRHARASIEVSAAPSEVWRLVAEFEHWPRWGPTISAVDSDNSAVGPGVTGRIKTIAGPWLPFEITEVEPGLSWHWKVAGIPATGHRLTRLGEQTTQVEFTVPILLAPYTLVLRAGLRRLKALAEPAGS